MSVYVDTPQPPSKVNFGWIGESFRLFAKAPVVWIVSCLIAGIVPVVGSVLINPAFAPHAAGVGFGPPPINWGLFLIVEIFSIVSSAYFGCGLFAMANKQVRGETIAIGDLFSNGKYIGVFILYNIIYGVATSIGAVLCILPAFVVFALLFPGFALLADGVDIGSALSRSTNGVGKDWLQAGLFALVLYLLLLVSVLAIGLGELVVVPMAIIIGSLMYRDMIGMPGGKSDIATQTSPINPGDGTVWPPRPEA